MLDSRSMQTDFESLLGLLESHLDDDVSRALALAERHFGCSLEAYRELFGFLKEHGAWTGHLTELRNLVLTNKSLYRLPASIGNTKLVSLPKELGQLERLKDLDLDANPLESLPMVLGHMKTFESLSLDSNQMERFAKDIATLLEQNENMRVYNMDE
jgi:Leucine-rich repeat (LRR) protein